MENRNIKCVTIEEYAKENNFTRKLARKAIDLALMAGFATFDTTVNPTVYEVRYDVEFYTMRNRRGKVVDVTSVREMPTKKKRVLEIGTLKGLVDNYTFEEIWKEFSLEELSSLFPVCNRIVKINAKGARPRRKKPKSKGVA
ncbi:MAG: hypothetical protein MRK01_01645 [Candidatus Scalindua sp.]|nr:hypothetical protein [Candidatus Scalindua sp.]